jgi:hypothetical protein
VVVRVTLQLPGLVDLPQVPHGYEPTLNKELVRIHLYHINAVRKTDHDLVDQFRNLYNLPHLFENMLAYVIAPLQSIKSKLNSTDKVKCFKTFSGLFSSLFNNKQSI